MIAAESEADRASLLRLKELGGIPVRAEQTTRPTTLKAKIVGVHPSFSESMIEETLRSYGVTSAARVKVRDPHTKVLKTTDQVILTLEGNSAPATVLLGLKQHALLVYRDPLQCYKCYRFGHRSALCKQEKPTCRGCGDPGHLRKDCQKELHCANRSGPHNATWGICPTRVAIMKNCSERRLVRWSSKKQ